MWWDEAQTFRRGVLGNTATNDDVTQATLSLSLQGVLSSPVFFLRTSCLLAGKGLESIVL